MGDGSRCALQIRDHGGKQLHPEVGLDSDTQKGGMAYILGTGYFNGKAESGLDWFARLWLHNSIIWPDRLPQKIICVSVGNSHPPYIALAKEMEIPIPIDVIDLQGNAGHIHQLIGKSLPKKDYRHCGVTSTFMALAALAYATECDLIYKEQDCLAFGQWVWALYEWVWPDSWGMAFGKNKVCYSAQSLFIIRHWFIPEFIKSLIQYGDERDERNLPEAKFNRLIEEHPNQVRQFDFGYDRDRPFNIDDPVFYIQKLTPEELLRLRRCGLIDLPPGMPDSACFTNDVVDRFKSV